MSERIPLTVNPATYKRSVLEAVCEHMKGDSMRAKTLAMMAGVNAGIMKLKPNEYPPEFIGHTELSIQWDWGRDIASTTNENNKQLGLL